MTRQSTMAVFLLSLLVFCVLGPAQTRKAEHREIQENPHGVTTPVASQKNDGQAPQPESPKHVDADVKVVSTPGKDGYDKVAFWISVFLAFVGSAGVIAATFTLRVLIRQAGEAKLQRIVTHNTLNAIKEQGALMKRQADAMDIQNRATRSRERARINVVFPPGSDPDFITPWKTQTDEGEEIMFYFAVEAVNHGISKAFRVRASMNFKIIPKESVFAPDLLMEVPITSVIGGSKRTKPIFLETFIKVSETDSVQTGNSELYVYGEISYTDVFDDKHITPFRFVWSVDVYEIDGEKNYSGGWENRSPAKNKVVSS